MIRRKFRKIAEANKNRKSDEPWAMVGEEVTDRIATDEQVVITSEAEEFPGFHAPVIDLDLSAALIPSTTPGKAHLYIDALVPGNVYFDMLDAMARAGVVEKGYADAARERRYSAVRLPWVKKP